MTLAREVSLRRPGPGDQNLLVALCLADRLTIALTAALAEAVGEASADNQGVRILYALRDRGTSRQAALGVALGCDPGQLSRLVAGLHGRGLLARRRDPDDARARLLRVTPRGRRAIAGFEASIADALRAEVGTLHAVVALLEPPGSPPPDRPVPVSQVLQELARVGSLATAAMTRSSRRHGVEQPFDARVLRAVVRHRAVGPSTVADDLGVQLPRVSRAASLLAGRGLLTRQAEPEGDRRRVRLEPTPLGDRAVSDVMVALAEHREAVAQVFRLALVAASDRPATANAHDARAGRVR